LKFYCKKQPVGEWLRIPDSWKVENLHYEKGFISIENLPSWHSSEFKMPYFLTVGAMEPFRSLSELCQELPKFILGKQSNFWLLYYYSLENICLLAAEKNYLSDYTIEEGYLE